MKNKPLVLVLAAFSLIVLGNGCNKPETVTPAPPVEAVKTPDKPSADALSAAQAQKAADSQQAADALKAADAQKQAEADKADQALKQAAVDKLAADKLAADQAATDKQSQLAVGTAKLQALIDSAKTLAGQNKWADVLKILSDLAGQKLSPAQQTAVDGLKSDAQKQAQSAVADKAKQDAGNALGGLLDPKK
jgi:hypothetical protein